MSFTFTNLAAASQRDQLIRGITAFSKKLGEKAKKPADNIFFSPVIIHGFISLLSQDPWFYEKNDFATSLCVPDVIVILPCYKEIFETLNNVNNLYISNTVFLKYHTEIQNDFKYLLTNTFASDVKYLNFTEKEGATKIVNDWMHSKTHRKIINVTEITDETYMYFLNTAHLEGTWAEPFSQTVLSVFHIDLQNIATVEMMQKKGEFYFKYDVPTGAQILKLPLANTDVSVIFILPAYNGNFPDLSQATMNMAKQETHVYLPKFKADDVLELTDYLKEMGLNNIFDANLTGVTKGDELTFKGMQQKTHLNLHEEGLEIVGATQSTLTKGHNERGLPKDGLVIYETNMSTEISNRFANTKVVWRVKNVNKIAAEMKFKVVLTENAFITEFIMQMEGKSYKSYIKKKEEAKNIYKEALRHGRSAGLVEAKTRDSQEFTVSVNVEPDSVAVFSLIYEEMLQRRHNQYELVLNICPGQIVEDMAIEVRINESRPLKFVKTPPLRSGDDLNKSQYDRHLDPESDIKMVNSRTASVKFRPDPEKQKKMGHYLGRSNIDGLAGQLVVQYDVEREPLNGEVLLQDGYFVHFFAPNDLDPLPKHVVFVLDTSGSMLGRKIDQLKDAMVNILDDLEPRDMLNIIEFNSEVIIWDINSKKLTSLTEDKIKDFRDPFTSLQRYIIADPQQVSDSIIRKAKEVVQNISAQGRTFMIGGIETALYVIKTERDKNTDAHQTFQPIIIFLTDGEPNVGVNAKHQITEIVTQLNTNDRVPVFTLSFGNHADKNFLRELSLKNLGFSRHIYEAADASLQLQEFYKQISCPLLHDIRFKYEAQVEEVTRSWFPLYFKGSELIVAGRYRDTLFPTTINCWGQHGPITIPSSTEKPTTSLERLWAYLTVKQLLDQRSTAPNPVELTEKAIYLSLKYSFVTEVTSLVVVKPNEDVIPIHSNFNNDATTPSVGSPQTTAILFGSSQTASTLFGSSQVTTAGFGNPSTAGTLFGSSQSVGTGFGNPSPAGTLFGSSQSVGTGFGNPAPASTLFGSSRSVGISFGNPSTAGTLFGSSRSVRTGFGNPSTAGTLFGSSQSVGTDFGNPSTAVTLFGSSQSTPDIGNQSTATTGFGNPLTFGNSAMATQFGTYQKKRTFEEFKADRPFLIMCQLEKENTNLILFMGYVCRPIY